MDRSLVSLFHHNRFSFLYFGYDWIICFDLAIASEQSFENLIIEGLTLDNVVILVRPLFWASIKSQALSWLCLGVYTIVAKSSRIRTELYESRQLCK